MSNLIDNGRHRCKEMIPYNKNTNEYGDVVITSGAIGMFEKLSPNAEVPRKEEGNDYHIGHHLTIVERTDGREDDLFGKVNEFSIKLAFKPPPGFYYEIVSRPNLIRAGYEVAGGTIIVDPNDEDEVIVPLKKFEDRDDLQLPFVGLLLVPRLNIYVNIIQKDNGIGVQNNGVFDAPTQQPSGRRSQQAVAGGGGGRRQQMQGGVYRDTTYDAPPIPGRTGGGRTFQPDFGGDDRPTTAGRSKGGKSGRSNMF